MASPTASSPKGRPQCWQCAGRWSSCASTVSANARACPLWPGLAPPGREPSRLPFRSVDGGFDDVRDVLSGRCRPSSRSINSGLVSRSSSSRFTGSVNHRPPTLAKGWVITNVIPACAGSKASYFACIRSRSGIYDEVSPFFTPFAFAGVMRRWG